MKHTFMRLRAELQANDIDIAYLGNLLEQSNASIGRRLRNEVPWNLSEMYSIMHILHWPTNRMHELFPPDGKTVREATP